MAVPEELRQAAAHLRAGRGDQARPILAHFLRVHPDSDQGWFLLSLALIERNQQIDCLERALRLNPSFEQARHRLSQLTTAVASPPSASQPQVRPESAGPSQPAFRAAEAGTAEKGSPFRPAAMPPTGQVPVAGTRYQQDKYAAVEPQPAKPAVALTAHRGTGGRSCLVGLLVVVGIAAVGGAAAGLYAYLSRPSPLVATSLEAVGGGATLPPSWTPTITTTITPTRTLTPVPSATPTVTPIPPEPTTAAMMDRIQKEVSDIRGLSIMAPVGRYVISQIAVRPILEASFLGNGGSREAIADEARVLSALGLIKPTYDLYTNALNSLTDSLGGFYFPWSKELFVIGGRFSGVEHYIYSHEYGHALVDQHFNIAGMGVYPQCLDNEDRCAAIRALTEGDATLLMGLWWRQYASPQDWIDIFNYAPPQQTLPQQFPPPYVIRDGNFPYQEGLTFVTYLHNRGNWAEVNKAYTDLPASTEQILHPEKYVRGEQPIDVAAPALGDVLGESWRLLISNTLGEWTTYLVLGYGADVDSQMEDVEAQAAARGWGGDSYQVYYNDSTEQTVMAVHWVWDTTTDAEQFYRLMIPYQNARFRGASADRPDAKCWSVNDQLSCIFLSARGTLWLLAPDQAILNAVLAKYQPY